MAKWTVCAFLRAEKIGDYPLSKKDYRDAYFELSEAVRARGGQLFVALSQDSYLGEGKFAKGWLINAPGEYEELDQPEADVLYDKGNFVSDGAIPVLNDPRLSELCTDKYLMYQVFPEYCPKTIMAKNQQEFLGAIDQLRTQQAVAKPVRGFEGHDVVILPKEDLRQQTVDFPILVQEFLDTSPGIPDIIDGVHDLRIAIFDGEIIFSYVRTPPPGKLTANVAQGGSFFMVPEAKLPKEVLEIVAKIDERMKRFPTRFYGVDLGVTPEGIFLIEMNARLGLFANDKAPEFAVLKAKLAETFAKMSQANLPKTFALVGKPQPSFAQFLAAEKPELRVINFHDHRDVWPQHDSIAKTYKIDFSNKESVLDALKKIDEPNIIGMYAGYENGVLPKAWMCEYYGLPSLSEAAAEMATDKKLMRAAFHRHCPQYTPAYQAVSSWEDAEQFASQYGFPLILKPANLVKSLLVTKNDSLEELRENYQHSIEKIAEIYQEYGVHHREAGLLIEEYLDGASFSVEVAIDREGQVLTTPVVDLVMAREIGVADNYNYSRITPSRFPQEAQEQLQLAAVASVQALELTNSWAHVEIIMTDGGPKIIEVGARVGGYRKAMMDLSYGISSHHASFNLATGRPIDLTPQPKGYTAVYEIFPEKLGVLKEMKPLGEVRELPSFYHLNERRQIGDTTGLAKDGYKFCFSVILFNEDEAQFKKDCQFVEENCRAITA